MRKEDSMHRWLKGITVFASGIAVLSLVGIAVWWAGSSSEEQPDSYDRSDDLAALIHSADPWNQVAGQVTLTALEKKYYEEGVDANIGCLDFGESCLLLAPDTPPERMEELLREMEEFYREEAQRGKTNYNDSNRWTVTATDASTGSAGDPITLTWVFMPDGVNIPAAYGSPAQPSILHAVFDTTFNTPDQWKNKIRSAFSKWDDLLGSTYIEVAYDDGASFPNSAGQLGVRADVRIGGKPIDGGSGILAYNWYPNGSDMVLDTDDAGSNYINPMGNYSFIKNTVQHEHGHGMGFGHVMPIDQTKLMEPNATLVFSGAQDDDIRGAQRFYGDYLENNDDVPTASPLGTLVDTMLVENVSIDRSSDSDYYAVTLNDPFVDIVLTPVGSTYLLGDQGGSAPVSISTDSINDPDFEVWDSTGTALLASSTSAGIGEVEALIGFAPPSMGKYIIHIFRKAGTGNGIQRYSLMLVSGVSTGVLAADGSIPSARSLDLSVAPNPFNPQTTLRFNMPEEGAYRLEIYDVGGRLVQSRDGRASAGEVELNWNGKDNRGMDAASGVYLMKVSAGGSDSIKRATLVR